jgi:hypothetical protein
MSSLEVPRDSVVKQAYATGNYGLTQYLDDFRAKVFIIR